jgi:DNA invertase Pin-like site-specific DNA recombinase
VSKWGNCIQCQRDYQKNYRRERPKTGTKGGGNEKSGRQMSTERKALLDAAVADGWPIRQIIATYGIGTSTVKRYYPDYRGMPLADCIVLSHASRRLNQKQSWCA